MRRQTLHTLVGLLCMIAGCGAVAGQYISADTYTRYELLAPESHQFQICESIGLRNSGAANEGGKSVRLRLTRPQSKILTRDRYGIHGSNHRSIRLNLCVSDAGAHGGQ